MESARLFIGVDVGTSSVRAALITSQGNVIANVTQNITVWEPGPTGFYEQSSNEIWEAVCSVVNSVSNGTDKSRISGIGFDATCSLVVLAEDFSPLPVNETEESHWNVIMWMDHRAAAETDLINRTRHEVLRNVGGVMSLEMQMPKLLWLKQNMKEKCWDKAGHFFDLPDFLTWKATGSLSRSLCSLVCKWTFQADRDGNKGWSNTFLKQIGLQDLIENNYKKIGSEVFCPGELCGTLTEAAASKMGLPPGIPVATSIIDAHAGGIGTLGCVPSGITDSAPLSSRLALICGTSSCHMIASEQPCYIPGVWGPYYSSMVPGLWLNEAGQSATGKLIDHILETHPAYSWIKSESESRKIHPQSVLNEVLEKLARNRNQGIWELTEDLHVWPDFHGNRSPIADATLKGMVCGLTLDSGVESLALLYLATLQSLAYGTCHIVEALRKSGHTIQLLYICGGLRKNSIFLQTHADVLGLSIICPDATESVLLGAAMLGACASGHFPSLQIAMEEMNGYGKAVNPNKAAKRYHAKKYAVFLKMVEHQQLYRRMMKNDTT